MSKQVLEKTKFIVLDTQDDFHTKWCGRIIDSDPIIKNNKPIFVIVSGRCRLELNTNDMNYVERMAKKATCPKGRQAITSDSARIYIKEKSNNEMLLGVIFHIKTKTFAPIQDKEEKLIF